MAGAAAKRTAAANEKALSNLRKGMTIVPIVFLLLRIFLPWQTFPPSIGKSIFYVVTFLPSLAIYQYLHGIGTPRRDPKTGNIISAGRDLSESGMTDLCWDLIYVTWGCQIGSTLLGDWVWWFYLFVPGYGIYKFLTGFYSKMMGS